jgi:hypothetical protein
LDQGELELLLALDGSDFEMTPGVIVEFTARRTDVTPERPHGISYAFVLRAKEGGHRGCASTMLTRLRKPSGDIDLSGSLMTTGTGPTRIRDGRITSRRLRDSLKTFGER